MAYTQFLKEFGDITNWNIDYLFNYFDLDNLDLIDPNSKQSLINWIINIFSTSISKIIYFYYPLFQAIKEFFIEFFSLNWIKDFSNISLLYNKTVSNIVNEDIFIKSQFLESFDIIQLPIYVDNKFFIGFLNSIFLALPFSCNQIIYFYRFFVSGPTVSSIGILGWLFGQASLFICVLFGLKPIIFQWFSLEPLNYFLNLYLIGSFIYQTIKNQPRPLMLEEGDDDDESTEIKYAKNYRVPFTINYKPEENELDDNINQISRSRFRSSGGGALFRPLYQPDSSAISQEEAERSSKKRYNSDLKSSYPNLKSKYIKNLKDRPELENLEKIFATHFLLSWTENNHIFSYLKDLNMGLETNIFEITTVNFFSSYFLVHTSYIFGIIFGSLFFSLIYLIICFQFITGIFAIALETDIFKIPKLKRKSSIKIENLDEKLKRREKELENENNNNNGQEDIFGENKQSLIKKSFETLFNIFRWITNEISKLFYELSKLIYEEETIKIEDKDQTKKSKDELKEEEERKAKENFPKIFRAINFNFLLVLIAFTLSSLSYYDVSYLITNPLGFIPQDKELMEILLTSNSDDPNLTSGFGSKKDFLDEYDNDYMQLDVVSLDEKDYKNTLEFENLNYQAEYAWLSKLDKFGGNETRQSVDKHKRLRRSQHNSLIVEHSEIYSPLQINTMERYENDLNKNKNINNIIDDNYIQSNTKFQFNKNSIDSNFKLDFIPFNKYSLADEVVDKLTLELETEIKQKFYSNPIYKNLLHYDIDTLLSRQPANFKLLELEENDIFQKRKALSNYYESNYYYTQLNYFDTFRKTFFNSKSYLNNIYNQQFGGTLRIVEKLFPITLNNNNRAILKYDFPLLDNSNTNKFQHEELIDKDFEIKTNYKGLINTSSSPLFLAWNDNLHQLVVTNNLLLKKAIKSTDGYSKYSFNNDDFISGPMTLFNIQKLNNLSRNSYSIIQYPSLRKLFSNSNFSDYSSLSDLDQSLVDNPDELYLSRLSTLSNPDKNRNISSSNINWYAFRYNFDEYKKNIEDNQEIYNESKKEKLKEDSSYRSIVEGMERR